MKAVPTDLPEVLLLEPRVFEDFRGTFFESYSERDFREATGVDPRFVQDNHSISARGVLRGLHYQLEPKAQGKLVRVISGEVYDVAVDVRARSPRLGHWTATLLGVESRRQIWIPPGFAHGFLALTEGAEVLYKTTALYDPACERVIRWDDPELGIDWPGGFAPRLSEKDARAPGFADAELFPDPERIG